MPATTTLADTGYTEAMRLMALGRLRGTELWRPEAFDRYRAAVVDGEPSADWVEQFNIDLQSEIGDDYTARFIDASHPNYPLGDATPHDGWAVMLLLEKSKSRKLVIIIRPEAEQALVPVVRARFFP